MRECSSPSFPPPTGTELLDRPRSCSPSEGESIWGPLGSAHLLFSFLQRKWVSLCAKGQEGWYFLPSCSDTTWAPRLYQTYPGSFRADWPRHARNTRGAGSTLQKWTTKVRTTGFVSLLPGNEICLVGSKGTVGSLNMASGFLIPTLQGLIASEIVSHRCKFKSSVSHYVNTEDLILSKKWKVGEGKRRW